MPSTPVRPRFPNSGSPPPRGSVAPLPMTLSVHSGAISFPSRLAEAYCGRTLLQSHCNSSHTIMALEVHTPWPSSVWAMRIVTVSSGATTTQALISLTVGSMAQAAPSGWMIWADALCGIQNPTTSAPVAAAAPDKRSRRDRPGILWPLLLIEDPPSRRQSGGGEPNCLTDAVVGAAATGVGDLGVDLRIRRISVPAQQRHGAHDHAGLTVAALRHVELDPGALHGVCPIRRQTLDGCHRFAGCGHDRKAARADRLAIDVQRAGPALRDAATEFRAGEPKLIADHPKQRSVRRDID